MSAEFLGHIRNADALAIVVRCFENPQAPHPAGSIDAGRDLDDLLTELALTDLATVDKRIETTARKAKTGDKKFAEELAFLNRLRAPSERGPAGLGAGISQAGGRDAARAVPADDEAAPLRGERQRGCAGGSLAS